MAIRRKLPKPPPDTKPIGECTPGEAAAHFMTRDGLIVVIGVIETNNPERYYKKAVAWVDKQAYWSHLRQIEDAISAEVDNVYREEDGRAEEAPKRPDGWEPEGEDLP